MSERRCCDDCVGQSETELPNHSARPFGDGAVHGMLFEWREQLRRQICRRVSGKQLRPGDDRVVQSMPPRSQFRGAAKVIDEDVGVDENISHDATFRDSGRLLRETLRMS